MVFEEPETAQVMAKDILREENRSREIIHDPRENVWRLEDYSDEGERRLPHNGIKHGSINKNTYTIMSGNPLSAKAQCHWELSIGREGWDILLVTNSDMSSDKDNFYVSNRLTAYYNDEEYFDKTWQKTIPRNFQ